MDSQVISIRYIDQWYIGQDWKWTISTYQQKITSFCQETDLNPALRKEKSSLSARITNQVHLVVLAMKLLFNSRVLSQ